MISETKKEYIKFCNENKKKQRIFHETWWLNSTCGRDSWDVALVKDNNRIIAAFPYYFKRLFGFKILIQPPLTQKLGFFFTSENDYNLQKNNQKKYREIISELIDQLPKFSYFNQFFYSEIINWLPFFWKGFQQTSFYSYKIHDIRNKNILDLFSKGKIKDLSKANKNFDLRYNDISPQEFYEHHKKSLKEKKQTIFYKLETLEKIFFSISKNKSGFVISAIDKKTGEIAALLLTICDENDSYSIISSIAQKYKKYAPLTLLFYNSIIESKKYSKNYDFEGGMDMKLGDSFRHMGGEPVEYYNIKKTSSSILKVLIFCMNLIKFNKLRFVK